MACSRLSLPMWKLLQRFNALDRRTQGFFLRAAILLPVIAASLRLRGLRATQRTLGRFLSTPNVPGCKFDGSMAKDAARIARMVHAAARYGLVRPTCLEKSVALWWFLGRRGIASSLRIGTRKSGDRLEAHAWIEFGGSALDDAGVSHRSYAPFDAPLPAFSRK
jgi:Transglutaminase-like superfamily